MSQYFPEPFRSFGGNINVKVDLSNYPTKTDFKNVTHVDTSSFALKTNLPSLKTEVDKLDIDKLAPIPVDLSKLSDVVKIEVVKKDVYDKLVAKVDDFDPSDFVLKTNYNADKTELEKKIPDTSGLVKKTNYNTKIFEIEGKIPDVSNLPDVSSPVKRTDYNTKITEIEKKLTDHIHDVFNGQASLITKMDFDSKLSNLNRKITTNKSKHLLVENELNN